MSILPNICSASLLVSGAVLLLASTFLGDEQTSWLKENGFVFGWLEEELDMNVRRVGVIVRDH